MEPKQHPPEHQGLRGHIERERPTWEPTKRQTPDTTLRGARDSRVLREVQGSKGSKLKKLTLPIKDSGKKNKANPKLAEGREYRISEQRCQKPIQDFRGDKRPVTPSAGF